MSDESRESAVYSTGFFEDQMHGSEAAARKIVPLVVDLIHPKSVVDIGCGVGGWLKVFRESGIGRIVGVDGDYVDQKLLMIPSDCFHSADLKQPVSLGKFDLAMSLEVAEHLPEECADQFVATLVAHAPVILFSAAVPHQGGTHHINEQWPSYWVKKFGEHGYACFDCIRHLIWDDQAIPFWYRQNIFIFIRESEKSNYPDVKSAGPNDVVHPALWYQEQKTVEKLRKKIWRPHG